MEQNVWYKWVLFVLFCVSLFIPTEVRAEGYLGVGDAGTTSLVEAIKNPGKVGNDSTNAISLPTPKTSDDLIADFQAGIGSEQDYLKERDDSLNGGIDNAIGEFKSGDAPVNPAQPPVTATVSGVPEGTFHFVKPNVLASSTGVEDVDLFNTILKGRQANIIEQFNKVGADKFKETSVMGDLDNGTFSFWDYNINKLYNNTSGTTVNMRLGTTEYKLYIPAGSGGQNKLAIDYAVDAIKQYKSMVQEAVLTGSVANSFNVYSMYPNKQIPLRDAMEIAKDEKTGASLNYKKFKSSEIKMTYSLVALYNPLFGKMEKPEEKDEYWTALIPKVALKKGEAGKVTFTVNSAYTGFADPDSAERETLGEYKTDSIPKSELQGVKDYTAVISKKKAQTKSLVDSAFRVIVPHKFTSKRDVGMYNINDRNGYKVLPDVKFVPTRNLVYGKAGEDFERLGDFATYGVDDRSLVLYKYSIDGKVVGVIIPLWFKEAVYDTGDSGRLFMTGRTVKFANDYSGKISFSGLNQNLLSVDSKESGRSAIGLNRFAFPVGKDYKGAENHQFFASDPEEFAVNILFSLEGENVAVEENQDAAGAIQKGFIGVRNNIFSRDADLLNWLETPEATSLEGVLAEELHNLITGDFDLQNGVISYEDWLRLQEIRAELDVSLKEKLMSLTRIIMVLMGLVIIIYSVILVLLYWVDRFNFIMDTSLLNLATFKRLYPIGSWDDMQYLPENENVRYVTIWNMLIICLLGIMVGLVFLFGTWLIEFLLWIYFKITAWVGV